MADIYYTRKPTAYQSQFIPMPLDFMHKKIEMAQQKYDNQFDLLQTLGDKEFNALAGEDTKYAKEVETRIDDFVNQSMTEDLGSREYARKYANFVRSINNDEDLKKVQAAYLLDKEHDQWVKEQKDKNNWSDAMDWEYQRRKQLYTQGKGFRGDIGIHDPYTDLGVEDMYAETTKFFKDLDKSYLSPLFEVSGETLGYQDGKWTGVSDERIVTQWSRMFDDFKRSKAGKQMEAQWNATNGVSDYEISRMDSAKQREFLNKRNEFLGEQFLEAGATFAQAGVTGTGGKGTSAKKDPSTANDYSTVFSRPETKMQKSEDVSQRSSAVANVLDNDRKIYNLEQEIAAQEKLIQSGVGSEQKLAELKETYNQARRERIRLNQEFENRSNAVINSKDALRNQIGLDTLMHDTLEADKTFNHLIKIIDEQLVPYTQEYATLGSVQNIDEVVEKVMEAIDADQSTFLDGKRQRASLGSMIKNEQRGDVEKLVREYIGNQIPHNYWALVQAERQNIEKKRQEYIDHNVKGEKYMKTKSAADADWTFHDIDKSVNNLYDTKVSNYNVTEEKEQAYFPNTIDLPTKPFGGIDAVADFVANDIKNASRNWTAYDPVTGEELDYEAIVDVGEKEGNVRRGLSIGYNDDNWNNTGHTPIYSSATLRQKIWTNNDTGETLTNPEFEAAVTEDTVESEDWKQSTVDNANQQVVFIPKFNEDAIISNIANGYMNNYIAGLDENLSPDQLQMNIQATNQLHNYQLRKIMQNMPNMVASSDAKVINRKIAGGTDGDDLRIKLYKDANGIYKMTIRSEKLKGKEEGLDGTHVFELSTGISTAINKIEEIEALIETTLNTRDAKRQRQQEGRSIDNLLRQLGE